MKYLLALVSLLSLQVNAADWETDYFTVSLPEHFLVETDRDNRLLAFSTRGPFKPPFLSIEFGERIVLGDLKSEIDWLLKENFGSKLASVDCKHDCDAYYFGGSTTVDGVETFVHYYLARTAGLSFVISFLGIESLEAGRKFVDEVGRQIIDSSA